MKLENYKVNFHISSLEIPNISSLWLELIAVIHLPKSLVKIVKE